MKFKDHENFKRITLRLKNQVGIIIIFLALSPKWPFEISKIAKFTAKLFILLTRGRPVLAAAAIFDFQA